MGISCSVVLVAINQCFSNQYINQNCLNIEDTQNIRATETASFLCYTWEYLFPGLQNSDTQKRVFYIYFTLCERNYFGNYLLNISTERYMSFLLTTDKGDAIYEATAQLFQSRGQYFNLTHFHIQQRWCQKKKKKKDDLHHSALCCYWAANIRTSKNLCRSFIATLYKYGIVCTFSYKKLWRMDMFILYCCLLFSSSFLTLWSLCRMFFGENWVLYSLFNQRVQHGMVADNVYLGPHKYCIEPVQDNNTRQCWNMRLFFIDSK